MYKIDLQYCNCYCLSVTTKRGPKMWKELGTKFKAIITPSDL